MALRPITETCEPRDDVLRGGLTDAHFAAQLDQVVRDPTKYPVYGDPTAFFAVTHPTEGLKRLLSSTFGRLSGQSGKIEGAEHGVVRFQTSFGGGKTHGLIAAYHLAKGARPPAIGEFVDPDLLPKECHVAAVVGDTLDPSSGTEVEGHKVFTMWGALAAQLGDQAWEAIETQDATRTAPGTEVWVELFQRAPTLVIIDEVAAHMRTLSSSGDPDLRRQAEAMPSCLLSLFTAAARVDTARVVITLATETDAFAKETAEVTRVLDTETESGRETQSVISRFREVLVPAEQEEISAILRRRLFATVDETAAADAAKAFADYYGSLEKRGVELGFAADIRDRVQTSYPLHPEVVNVLDNRVGTIPDFNRTRGALRLLAESVSALWDRKTNSVVINVADLPLDASAVGNALTRGIDREPFAQVLEADVAGPSSHAAGVDKVRFAGAKPYVTRAATTVFVHSLEHTASRGANQTDVWRGTLVPDDDPDLIEEALVQLDHTAWHLDYDGARWKFDTEPNPRKIIEDEKVAVPASHVREVVDERISKMFAPHGPLKTRMFPKGPEAIDDGAELQLAVLHYEDTAVTSRDASPPPDELVTMLDTHGIAGSNRTFRNGVVFLVADSDQIAGMREAVRWDLAAQRIKNDGERMATYAESVRKKLKDIADKAGLDARVAITRCYRHLYYPKADKANKHLRHHELPHSAQGDQEKNQTQVIQQALEGLGKISDKPIATDFLAKVAGFPGTDPIATNKAVEGFWRDHNADIILNPNRLTDAIGAGIRNGEWVYYDSESEKAYGVDTPPPAVKIAPTTYLYSRGEAEKAGLLRRDPSWSDIERELAKAKGELSGPELRSKLEATLGYEPSKGSITEILGRVLKQEPVPIVITDGEPTAASKPLAASSVAKLSLERLTVLTRERAEEIGIPVSVRPTGFKLIQEGTAGPAFGTLTDQLAELGAGKTISEVSISKTVIQGGTSELRTLLSAVPMLPKLDFIIRLNGSGSFADLSGDVQVSYLSGASSDFRKVEKEVLGLLDRAQDLTAELTLICTSSQGIEPGGDGWNALGSTISDLKPGEIRVEVTGA
jgi:hypothetical protein